MELYEYQKRVANHLRNGKSVILQAPTGSGKTIAALWPYLEAWDKNQPERFPRKCIYSVPMRVLANQFVSETRKLVYENMNLVELPNIAIQTGENSEDPKFLGDLIFATIDQSLSSALAVPYSLSPGLSNLNAGAFFSSYLVFDEFHLFPVSDDKSTEGALTTTLQLLTKLKGITPFVLMTATFSSTMLGRLAGLLNAEVVTVSEDEYRRIATFGGKESRNRQFLVYNDVISANAVLQAHHTRSIAICNQVKRAQILYQELQEKLQGTDTRVVLLHSRFTADDRKRKEDEIRVEFGKDEKQKTVKSLILVATQVVEVGLDITCEHLHTEIAPANAVLQRAGRCARFPGEQGFVHVYRVPEREGKEGQLFPDFLPYSRILCEKSWSSLEARSGQLVDFKEEQAIIDEVHTDSDKALLDAMESQSGMLWDQIFSAMGGDSSYRQALIRRIDNITVMAAGSPGEIGNPYAAEGFGLWRGTVKGILRDLEVLSEEWEPDLFEDKWLMAYPTVIERNADDPTQRISVNWQEVTSSDLLDVAAMVVVNSEFCAYDEELGFRIVSPPEGGWRSGSRNRTLPNSQGQFSYRLESYSQHITNMLRIFNSRFRSTIAHTSHRLEQTWDLPPGGIDRSIQLAIALHDLGKLEVRWQKWVRAYQTAIGEPIGDSGFMAVHTHWLPTLEAHKEAKKKADRTESRPHHAGESAAASAMVIKEALANNDLGRAVCTAIARHHSPHTDGFNEYRLHPSSRTVIEEALRSVGIGRPQADLFMSTPGFRLDQLLVSPKDFRQIVLYLLVVRMLRLCDGLSQE